VNLVKGAVSGNVSLKSKKLMPKRRYNGGKIFKKINKMKYRTEAWGLGRKVGISCCNRGGIWIELYHHR
jgi:hypothetical protein